MKKLFNKPWFYLAIFSFIILTAFLIIKTVLINTPRIEFTNSSKIKLNSTYEEDYTVKYFDKDITDKVIVEGHVDTTKVGDYELTYIIDVNGHKHTKRRVISVIDTIPPVLSLIGKEDIVTCPNGNYIEEGYTAIDNYDGDITSKVVKKRNKNNIVYKVKDSSNNVSEKKRNIIEKDEIAPVLTLKKSNNVYVYLNQKYIEEGYTAIDNCDLDITNKVEVKGLVNTNALGVYQLTYTVSDSIGLLTSITRTIHVINKPDNSKKTIYLTFDDGPSQITSNILDILKAEGVKATFFVIGKSSNYDNLIIRAYNEGHSIGLHSYSHNYATIYTSDEAFFNDLNLISERIKNLIGIESKIFRFPGGSSNTTSKKYNVGIMSRLTVEITNRGYVYFDWNVGSIDTQAIGADRIYQNVITNLSSGNTSIVLMHDTNGNWQTVNALKNIITYGKEMGYNFAAITTSTPAIRHHVAN